MVKYRQGKGGTANSYTYPIKSKGGGGGKGKTREQMLAPNMPADVSSAIAGMRGIMGGPPPASTMGLTIGQALAPNMPVDVSSAIAGLRGIMGQPPPSAPAPKGGGGGTSSGGGIKHGSWKGKWSVKARDMLKEGQIMVVNNDDTEKKGKKPKAGRGGGRRYAIVNREKAIGMVEKLPATGKLTGVKTFRKRLTDKTHTTYKNWEIHTNDKQIQALFGIK